MGTIIKNTTSPFSDGDQITSEALNNLIDDAILNTTAVSSGTGLTVDSSTGVLSMNTTLTGKTLTSGSLNSSPIGASSPSTGAFTTLSASGGYTGNVTGDITGNVTGGTGSFTTLSASGDVTFDTTTLKVDSTNNRVGIGTASPAVPLDVNGQARVVGNLFVGTDDTTPNGMIEVYGAGGVEKEGGEIRLRTAAGYDTTYNHYFIDAYEDDLRIGREGGADITLASAGNVGIGTTTPSTALQVVGGVRVGSDGNEDLLLKRDTPAVTVGGSTAAGIITTTGTGAGSGHVGIEVPANDADDGFYIATDSNLDGTVDKLALKINALGNVGIGTASPDESLDVVGAGRFSTGVTFGTDTAAANKLDDYEEGSWTPTISFGGASVSVEYDLQVGTYTKIGDLVTASCYMDLADKGSSTGAAVLAGLPFASRSLTGNLAAAALRVSNISFADIPMGYNGSNASTITLQESTNAGTVSTLTNGNFSDTSIVTLSISYRV